MSDVTTCAACGAQYFKAQTATCIDCGAPLGGPVLAPGDDEVGYELDDWDDEQRDALTVGLVAEGIAHRWEGIELVVTEQTADRVEVLIDALEGLPEEEDEDADGIDAAALLSALYVSSDVLQHEPSNPGAVIELLEAVELAPETPPYGIDLDLWNGIVQRADALADLLSATPDDERIVEAAKALRDAVFPLV